MPTGIDPTAIAGQNATAKEYNYLLNNDFAMARQAIINGGFDISQRNGLLFSSANPVTTTYLIDRWKVLFSNSGTLPTTITHSQQAHTPGDIPFAFYFYRIAPNGAGSGFGANDYYALVQPIEFGTRFLSGNGKKVTVSFWAKSSIASKRLGITLVQSYGTGGSPSASEVINGTNITLTATWTKYSWTFTTNTLTGKTFGTNNDDSLNLYFQVMWGTAIEAQVGAATAESFIGSGNIDISQVQFNTDEAILPYLPFGLNQELIRCQRYYEKSFSINTAPAQAAGDTGALAYRGVVAGVNTFSLNVPYKVVKRISPSVTFYNTVSANTNWYNASLSVDSGSSATDVVSNERGLQARNAQGASDRIGDLLEIHWAVDAEL